MKASNTISSVRLRKLCQSIALTAFTGIAMQGYSQTAQQYDAIPPSLAENSPPLIMLAMSVDHQLYFKSFTDYEDVNGDGVVDTGYNNNIDYAGYFDNTKCYVYDSADGRFEPAALMTSRYCNAGAANDQWSGNFLNWATMTRIDQVRSILYGGLRSTDTADETVLERSYLPNDAHSFAKYYNESDLGQLTPFGNLDTGDATDEDSGVTICNTTRHAGNDLSQDVTDPPLARVVDGNYSLWNANERAQCLYDEERGANNGNNSANTGIFAHSSNPSTADRAVQQNGVTIGDYNVRVLVCDANLLGGEDCKQYPDGNYKPVGLLQEFGEDGSAIWGLVSGSYSQNKSGGVLRKDIGAMDDEINVLTDGTFRPAPATGGIIAALDSLRIANYDVSDTYRYNNADSCEWGLDTFADGDCSNWGNPFAEILQECYRYFRGETAGRFTANDTGLFPGLITDPNWDNPQDNETACADLNVIAFNSSSVSYDADNLENVTTVAVNTNLIGANENIHGNSFFVGDIDPANPNGGTEGLCTAKTVGTLSDVRGTCPDSPRLSGSYNVAGLAYEAYVNDQRPTLDGDQFVTTWGVELAPGIPRVSIAVPGSLTGQTVSILPACRNDAVGGNCGLVDFKLVNQTNNGVTATGTFYVNWEDSEQGGDYDQDMSGILTYSLTSTTLQVTTDVFGDSTPYEMAFGYVLSGTANDGFHAHSGIDGYTGQGCNNCNAGDAATTATYLVGTSTASLLQSPLYYASKWGGFNNGDGSNEDNLPLADVASDDSEWDADGDGRPDNYVFAIDPAELKESLRAMVVQILERTSSGTAAAVNAQTGRGEGAIYQALYTPRIKETGNDLVTWVGSLRSFFIDEFVRIREDTDGNARLDDTDHVIEFNYDPTDQVTYIETYTANIDGTIGAATGTRYEISDSANARPIWDAQAQLDALSNFTENRSYSNVADSRRYIFTSFDRDLDGMVIAPAYATANTGQSITSDASHAFIASNFSLTGATANDFRYLGLDPTATQTDVDNLVNFIRGDETIAGDRNRTINGERLILGDIVHSTPAVVSSPREGYELAPYRDESYEEFADHYRFRRNVVYVGANDGMLHAFNSGFYDARNKQFTLSRDGETEHPLGAELWAYIPFNLLPHLQWLQDPDYPHVYYMDGEVQSFDVNIFPADDTYINGWGTIIVAGMRFGGGDYTLDHDGDPSTPDITTRSAYVVMDVTDPEQPPKLLAEITDADLGFALSKPTVVKYRKQNSSGTFTGTTENSWYLVFGSGPGGTNAIEREQALDGGVSFNSAKAYVFDLESTTLDKIDIVDENGDPELASFVGGFESVDWDSDYDDDATYYGLVSGTALAPTGKLKRARLIFNTSGQLSTSSANFSTTLFDDLGLPISATPTTFRSNSDEWWVYAGTGRFLVADDNLSNTQQYYLGIKEPVDIGSGLRELDATVALTELLNTTEIDVYSDGRVRDQNQNNVTLTANGVTEALSATGEFDDVLEFIRDNTQGWYFALETPPHTLNPLMRNTTKSALAGSSLVITAYEATGEVCDVTGDGWLFTPDLEAGVPGPFAPVGTDSNYLLAAASGNPGDPPAELVLQGVKMAEGNPSDPVVVPLSGGGGDDCFTVLTQTTTGNIKDIPLSCRGVPRGRQGWQEIPINW